MNLLSNLMDIIYIPLGLIFKLCYLIFSDYGLAILMFAFIARLAMLPFGIKNERNRLKMMSVQPKMAQLQAKYRGNTRDPKYAQEMQELYEKEGYNPMSGCLPQLIQLPLIWAIWNAIRRPLSYICDISVERIREIAMVMYNNGFLAGVNIKEGYTEEQIKNAVNSWVGVNEIGLASQIAQHKELVADLLPHTYRDINFTLLGISGVDLGATPSWSNWTLIIPIISGISSLLVGVITQKMNAPKDEKAKQAKKPFNSMNAILYIMPLISIWIGFSFSIAVGFYWIVSNIFSLLQAIILPKIMNRDKQDGVVVEVKEKKLNYNQIQKMEREKKRQQIIEAEKVETNDNQADIKDNDE